MNLEKKLPPPIVTAIFAGLAYISSLSGSKFTFSGQISLAFGFVCTGLLAIIVANIQFKQASTTINPLKPETTSSLVDTGIFGYSRNPMYLGMAFILAGFCLYFGSWVGLIAIPAFVQYMDRFQIIPEETALKDIFGENYTQYCVEVRRWI